MIKKFFFLSISILVSVDASSQEFDQKSLEKYIAEKLIYPQDALSKGTSGIVYIQFKVSSSGEFFQDEVRVLYGLTPSCDQEALRVVKSYANKNPSAAIKLFMRPYIIPIHFIPDENSYDRPSHYLQLPVITTVRSKPVNAKKTGWTVYEKKGLESAVGEVAVGDTVLVTGWSAWSYFIQTKEVTGFVSYNSLHINEAMQSVSELVNERSPVLQHIEEEERAKKNLVIPKDTVGNFSTETLYLALTSNKKIVYESECAIVSLTFNVRADNKLPIQFYDLGMQLSAMIKADLNPHYTFVVNNRVENIEGVATLINNQEYTVYKIYEAAYCPTTLAPLKFPAIKLKMLFGNDRKRLDKVGAFHSLPLSINVKPLPVNGITTYNKYKMVGDFSLDEKLKEQTVIAGKPFTFQINLKGTGLIFPVEPPKFKGSPLQITLRDIQSKDTIVNETLESSRTFTYQATMLDTGVFNFSKYVNFSFFNPSTL